jgi:hypothetical protein
MDQRKKDPTSFKKLKAETVLQSQMILGRFGYGTLFTGTLDTRTQDALRAYQQKKGIPASGNVDDLTYFALTKDGDAADAQPPSGLPSFKLFYHDDFVWGEGAWDRLNSSEGYLEAAHFECYKERSLCLEANAVELEIFGFRSINAKMTEFKVTKWDQYELVAEDNTPDCERDQLMINQQEKSVTILSTPTYKKESCKKELGQPQTVTYRLVDGQALSKDRDASARTATSDLYQLSDEAKAILKSK